MIGSAVATRIGFAMGIWQWGLEAVVVALLAVTLVRTGRLSRALTLVRQDRSGLEALLAGLELNMLQAKQGIERLQGLADGAGRRVEQQSHAAMGLREELGVLLDRGERLLERLEQASRAARASSLAFDVAAAMQPGEAARADAARTDPARAGRLTAPASQATTRPVAATSAAGQAPPPSSGPAPGPVSAPFAAEGDRVRSQAERDLLAALRAGR